MEVVASIGCEYTWTSQCISNDCTPIINGNSDALVAAATEPHFTALYLTLREVQQTHQCDPSACFEKFTVMTNAIN
ncbi:hypothetical protein EWB00_009786 [Schistosoma japonicum]|uniref:Uncharacterized protein n=1 Tax=Schistosoma japonicum TaxID=6182 RepID=A0A4Z2CLF0_SCHJA|nr:hypothetical protein EWB00_009786 [Schistosoma japonicum]